MRRTFIVPAIKSFDHYDFTRAKISCSLTWLVAKAFGSGRWRLLGAFDSEKKRGETPLKIIKERVIMWRAGATVL